MDRRQLKTWVKAMGRKVYAEYDPQESRMLALLGMHPAAKMTEAEKTVCAEFTLDEGRAPTPSERVDFARWLAVGAMEAANEGSDKMQV